MRMTPSRGSSLSLHSPAEAVAAGLAVVDPDRPLRAARQVLAWMSAVALTLALAAQLQSAYSGERLPMLATAGFFVVGWALLERRLTGGFLGLRDRWSQRAAGLGALTVAWWAASTL
jgi:hypothetical protein